MQNISFSSPDQVYFINYNEVDASNPVGTTVGWGASQVYEMRPCYRHKIFKKIPSLRHLGRRVRINETSLRFHEYTEYFNLR